MYVTVTHDLIPIQIATNASLSSTSAVRMLTVLTLKRTITAYVMRDTLEMGSLAMVSYTSVCTAYKSGEFGGSTLTLAG